ncbi:MAG: VWA domain-containing protein [Bryobacteraceae bacterium]|nr:VWA domain-containing protein [Bryobacteraceae bacterium]
MSRALLCMAWALLFVAGAQDTPVFRSDVSLVRVDVLVSTPDRRPVTGLSASDFRLLDNQREQPIRSFAADEMHLDVLFLIDVSVSMRPHVARIARASRDALATLAPGDRGAILVFDRQTRVRLPWTDSLEEVAAGLQAVVEEERFDGGTDITRALVDAARFIRSSSRRDSRRAIVIVTDDQTERDRNEARVLRALEEADAVLSALIAPDAMGTGRPARRPGWGDIILGPRYPGRYPGTIQRPRTQSAGTPEIARASGGDSLPVEHAGALQETLEALRQRYSLFFSVPADAKVGQRRTISVALARDAARRYPGAQLKYRAEYVVPADWSPPAPDDVSRTAPQSDPSHSGPAEAGGPAASAPVVPDETEQTAGSTAPPRLRRRSADESYGTRGPDPRLGVPAPGEPVSTSGKSAGKQGGWREATPADLEQAKAAQEAAPPKKK